MRLWSEYEGTTIAEAYPIEKLLRPEGRSAFFSTSNGTGTPAVIRLIESINDESEILSRWKTVADLQDTHLITLKKFGQTIFEGTPLIYVLMESAEADLSGILKERTLTPEETRQIATSLVGALETLHASGIVHEHVEPSNVMATGEEVKLRSDCIREAPEGDEGSAARKKDVHDLAVVLLQALTGRKYLENGDGKRLPAPFDQIVPNGMSGGWGLAQIAAALSPPVVKPTAVPVVRTPAAVAAATTQAQQIPLAIPRATEQTAWNGKRTEPLTAKTAGQPAVAAAVPVLDRPVVRRDRITVPIVDEETRRRRLWIAVAPVVIVIAAALGWHFSHKPATSSEPGQPITTLSEVQPKTAPVTQSVVTQAPQGVPAPAVAVAADSQHPWRVVAYTYNRQDQAQHKADTIAQRDAALRPEVFRPAGAGSFMVTVGGAMTRDEAVAFRQKAQSEGLPRDIYIQNYESREQRRVRRGR